MKREHRMQSRVFGTIRSATRNGTRTATLLQVHPLPADPEEVLSIVIHLIGHYSMAHGKAAPALSEDAAEFLKGRRWALDDLAARVSRAVAHNEGSLIIAADLA